jgi:hypothetical protein
VTAKPDIVVAGQLLARARRLQPQSIRTQNSPPAARRDATTGCQGRASPNRQSWRAAASLEAQVIDVGKYSWIVARPPQSLVRGASSSRWISMSAGSS